MATHPVDRSSLAQEMSSGTPLRRVSVSAPLDQLSVLREQRAADAARVHRYVDERLTVLESEESYSVPRLYVVIAGSLAPGQLLALVEAWSGRNSMQTGSPWVRQTVQEWVDSSGLDEHDWVAAREVLRSKGLIQERRCYDLACEEIVTELAFVPDAFAAEVARVREALLDDARSRMRTGEQL